MEPYVGKHQKNQVTRLVTLRHRSTMSGALDPKPGPGRRDTSADLGDKCPWRSTMVVMDPPWWRRRFESGAILPVAAAGSENAEPPGVARVLGFPAGHGAA